MKSRAERLRVLIQDDGGDGSDYVVNQIIALFKECVPVGKLTVGLESDNERLIRIGHNQFREETLKNIEEMGK